MGTRRSMQSGRFLAGRNTGNRAEYLLIAVVGLACLGTNTLCATAQDTRAQAAMERWVSAKFLGTPVAAPAEPYLMPHLDRGSRRVLRDSIEGHALLIAGETCARGLAMRSTGEVQVVLPEGAREFEATVGVDSNDLLFYSNQGRGSVVATVSAEGRELFRSPVLHEGMQGVKVRVELNGVRSFTLRLTPVGPRTPVYQADWDQADWAGARVTLEDGSEVELDRVQIGAPAAMENADAPFSFIYGGTSSQKLLPGWTVRRSTQQLDADRTQYTVTYTDAATQLEVRCVAVAYRDFPTVEWTVYFKNNGQARTPILEDIEALDAHFAGQLWAVPVVHHEEGSSDQPTDFRPFETALRSNDVQDYASRGGRPTDGDMPYFNVAWADRGLIAVLGWPGQWSLQMHGDADYGVRMVGGQQQTHFWLAPGEQVRTPLAVVEFWTRDWLDGQNLWRRWMVAHNLPRNHGKLPPPQLAAGSSHNTVEMQWATEANQKELFAKALAAGLPIDYWWMDAGWYPLNQGWWKTGTWEPDMTRFPLGLRGVSDVVHAQGKKVIVWFEPERVTEGSWLQVHHPEWLIGPKGRDQLLFLGNPEAWQWLVDHVSRLLVTQGIDTYRQDFNFEPLKLWQSHDTPDREGISEIEHVEGYLRYFDELHRRFPNLIIDTCASGGRRDDLETLRRAVPLWRSDFAGEPTAMQMQSYGLALWVPYYGTSGDVLDTYDFLSRMTPAMGVGPDGLNTPAQRALALKLIGEWKQAAGFYYDDYYPLTPYSTENTEWMGWQFGRADGGAGMVQVFRRPESPFTSAQLPLHGLVRGARYVVTDAGTGSRATYRGAELMDHGLPVAIAAKPGALLLFYRRAAPQAQ